MLFRVRKSLTWDGHTYKSGDLLNIPEGNPRLRALIEQSHHLEYANREQAKEIQSQPVEPLR